MTKTIPTRILLSLALAIAVPAVAAPPAQGFSLAWHAEHMLEVQMDARYLALAEIEADPHAHPARVDVGYLRASAGLLDSSTTLLGAQRYLPAFDDPDWGLILGGFYDRIRLGGTPGDTVANPGFTRNEPLALPFAVRVTGVSGAAVHAGVSLALTHRPSQRWAWQSGLALEYYKVSEFKVRFDTLTQSPNFSGEIDYSGSYHTIAPFLGYRYFYPIPSADFVYSSRVIAAWPLPYRGFEGRFSAPGSGLDGDIDRIDPGRHIPDFFGGVGFTIESVQRGWRLDVGSSLYLFLAEDRFHRGSHPPVLIHFSWPLQAR